MSKKSREAVTSLLFWFKINQGMIDFIKVAIVQPTAKELLQNPSLEFCSKVSERTGEVFSHRQIAEYQGMKFTVINQQYIEVSGSLHKFWHQGKNCTSYSYSDLWATVRNLYEKFGINPETARLKVLEVGVNVGDLPLTPIKLLPLFINHKGEPFGKMRNKFGQSIGIECYHQRYGIKIYDKGKQYNLPEPLLRYELKFIKMIDLNADGIVFLSDVLDMNKLQRLGLKLAATFNEILLIDPQVNIDTLTVTERRNYANYTNPKYWEQLRPNHKKYHYHKNRYQEIISHNVPDPMQFILIAGIKQEWNSLLDTGQAVPGAETWDKLTNPEKSNLGQINPSSNRLEYPNTEPGKQTCKITGRDISDQRPGSRFVSAKKIGYQEAHRLRNQDSNPRNNLRRQIVKYEDDTTLFQMNDFLKLSEAQEKLLEPWKGTAYEVPGH